MKRYIAKMHKGFKARRSAGKQKPLSPLTRGLLAVKQGLAQETRETKVMLSTYNRFTKGEASKQEMIEANQQFLDLVRGLGLGVLVVLPFAPITLPFVVKLGEKMGVNVLPSAFVSDIEQEPGAKTSISDDLNDEKEMEGDTDSNKP